MDDVGLVELNEPFAVQVLSWCDGLEVAPDDPRLNPYGGAIACGHPLAATGCTADEPARVRLPTRPVRPLRAHRAVHRARDGRRRSSGRTRGMADAVTQFHLQKVATRIGPLALVTIDNGADWTKPNTFGREALESLDAVLGRLRHPRLAGARPHRQAVRLRRGRGHHQLSRHQRRSRARGRARRARAVRPAPRPPVPDARRGQRRRARRRGRDRAALRLPHDLVRAVRHFACPEVFLGLIPGWGGTQLIPRLVGAEQAVRFIVSNPLRQNRMLTGAAGVQELGFADALLDPVEFLDESIEWLVARIEAGAGELGAARRRSLRRRRDLPEGAASGRRRRPRRVTRAVPRARPDRGTRLRGRWRRGTAPRRTRSRSSCPGRRRRRRSTRST